MAAEQQSAGVTTVEVFTSNADDELGRLRRVVGGFPLVAVAFAYELPRAAPRLAPAAPTLDASYEAIRADADRVRAAQLSLALGGRDGVIGYAWRFHLCELGAEDRRFLDRASANADSSISRGVDPRRLGAALVAGGAVLNRAVTRIARGAEDVAYMVQCLTGGAPLPPTREAFLRLCGAYFPVLYDQELLLRMGAASPTQVCGGDA